MKNDPKQERKEKSEVKRQFGEILLLGTEDSNTTTG